MFRLKINQNEIFLFDRDAKLVKYILNYFLLSLFTFCSLASANPMLCEFALDDITVNPTTIENSYTSAELRLIAKKLATMQISFSTNPQFVSDYTYRNIQLNKFNKELESLFINSGKELYYEELQKLNELEIVNQKSRRQDSKNREREIEEQKKTIREILDPLRYAKQMIFNELPGGKFEMGTDKIETELSPFEMAATPVTQMIWARLKIAMGETDIAKINPSHFKNNLENPTINLMGLEIPMQSDHPVDSVSWINFDEFIHSLNILSASPDPKIQLLLTTLLPGHQKGDYYDLPTEAQWEYVMRACGQANGKYFDRNDFSEVPDYAWTHENSDGHTHAVATKKARIVEGQAFFDMEGNVWEWVKDTGTASPNEGLPGGKDPLVNNGKDSHVVRGGSYFNSANHSSSSRRDAFNGATHANTTDRSTGGRLVRTRN